VRDADDLAENSIRYDCPAVMRILGCESCASQLDPVVAVTETAAEYDPTVRVAASCVTFATAPVFVINAHGESQVVPVRSNEEFEMRLVAAPTGPSGTRFTIDAEQSAIDIASSAERAVTRVKPGKRSMIVPLDRALSASGGR
jgi:hypothetical protein